MFRLTNLLFLCLFSIALHAQKGDFATPFEKDQNVTATYFEAIDYYKKLADAFPQLQLREWGATDAGFPLHTAVLSLDKVFDPSAIRKQNKRILFVNNAIHPGEPEGVDATMMLVRDILQKPELQRNLQHVVLVVIPYYNIGGGLNRGPYSRVNQNGPNAYGFRGNAKNLDLNRDFIKCDSKNALTFNEIFNYWQPDILIDNHTSNGADYTYTLTMLASQQDKLEPALGNYLDQDLLPRLYADMKARNWEMTPYVNNFRDTPDKGIYGFYDSPRYSSGYAALHNCIGFIPETHMLKPFPQRVQVTYAYMDVMLRVMNEQYEKIGKLKAEAVQHTMTRDSFPLAWTIARDQADTIIFKGYEGKYKPSEVTGADRLWYDRTAPFERKTPYWNTFLPAKMTAKPYAYIIPQAYSEVIERLEKNGVKLQRLTADFTPELEMYYIADYKTREAYEGHYLHYDVQLDKRHMSWPFHKGDYVAFTDQPSNRYLVESLEPQGIDSFFAWNFFDGILGQKEYFSSYVFEDLAAEFLHNHPEVKAQLEARKQTDAEFAKNPRAQLDWVYRQTPHYEPTYNLYPVGRVLAGVKMPVK
ncbi:MAG TPA: M14 family metallopeptidase [Flavilitoribacter sp.]|nr:M14 family metallopeptidase [Flavilitoribacter sp.]